jgi:hypothetical protein
MHPSKRLLQCLPSGTIFDVNIKQSTYQAKTTTMKNHLLLILCTVLINSCNPYTEEPIGKWHDIIKLSAKTVDFSAKADSVLITTKGDWWWINSISIGDSVYPANNREGINLESNSYVIKENGFVVERRKNALFVKLDENKTGIERQLKISLEAGDYFDDVCINQSAN